jgi:signal transduction histidine kinase
MRRRILTAALAVTAAALILFGVPFGWAVGRVYRSQQLARLQQAATTAAASVPVEGLHGSDPIEPPPSPHGVFLAYFDSAGALVTATGSPPATKNPDGEVRRALGGHASEGRVGARLIAAVPVTANETTIGAVEATSAAAFVTHRSEATWLAMLALGIAALGLAALFASWQARRLAAPVDDIVDAAGRLGDGDFTVPTRRSGIAELDRAGAALQVTAGRLGELLQRERSFTAHASHQLRTPLTALRLSLEGALQAPDAASVVMREAMIDAVRQVDRLEETLGQLLALARTGAPEERTLPMAQTLAEIEERWHQVLAERGRRLEINAADLAPERVAAATLGQVLDILVDNACTHGRGTVEIRVVSVGEGVTVEVADEGKGVSALPAARTIAGNGHGVGLALARSLVEASGGRLVLKPGSAAAGRGGAVAVILP